MFGAVLSLLCSRARSTQRRPLLAQKPVDDCRVHPSPAAFSLVSTSTLHRPQPFWVICCMGIATSLLLVTLDHHESCDGNLGRVSFSLKTMILCLGEGVQVSFAHWHTPMGGTGVTDISYLRLCDLRVFNLTGGVRHGRGGEECPSVGWPKTGRCDWGSENSSTPFKVWLNRSLASRLLSATARTKRTVEQARYRLTTTRSEVETIFLFIYF